MAFVALAEEFLHLPSAEGSARLALVMGSVVLKLAWMSAQDLDLVMVEVAATLAGSDHKTVGISNISIVCHTFLLCLCTISLAYHLCTQLLAQEKVHLRMASGRVQGHLHPAMAQAAALAQQRVQVQVNLYLELEQALAVALKHRNDHK